MAALYRPILRSIGLRVDAGHICSVVVGRKLQLCRVLPGGERGAVVEVCRYFLCYGPSLKGNFQSDAAPGGNEVQNYGFRLSGLHFLFQGRKARDALQVKGRLKGAVAGILRLQRQPADEALYTGGLRGRGHQEPFLPHIFLFQKSQLFSAHEHVVLRQQLRYAVHYGGAVAPVAQKGVDEGGLVFLHAGKIRDLPGGETGLFFGVAAVGAHAGPRPDHRHIARGEEHAFVIAGDVSASGIIRQQPLR